MASPHNLLNQAMKITNNLNFTSSLDEIGELVLRQKIFTAPADFILRLDFQIC